MRNPVRASLVVASLALSGALLTACTPSAPVAHESKTPAPSPSTTPIFASDAEALEAATAVYTKYLAAVDAIGHDGGTNPERVRPFVNAAGLQHQVDASKKMIAEHSHGVGDTKLNNTVLQSHDESTGAARVRIYACQDISAVDVIDPSGKSLVSENRADYIAYEVSLTTERGHGLVIQSNKYWSGGGVCKF